MEAYCAFVQSSLESGNPAKAARQKAIEEIVEVRFRVIPPLAARGIA
jgi:hypothetical protein